MRRGTIGAFSLGELMLAFMLLSLISVVMIGVVPSTIIGLKTASQRANAALLAENQLEELRRSGFGSLAPSVEPYPQVRLEQTDYTIRVEVNPAIMSSGETMDVATAKQVAAVVTWDSRTGSQTHAVRAVMFKRI